MGNDIHKWFLRNETKHISHPFLMVSNISILKFIRLISQCHVWLCDQNCDITTAESTIILDIYSNIKPKKKTAIYFISWQITFISWHRGHLKLHLNFHKIQTIFKSVLTLKGLSKFNLREFNKIIGSGELHTICLLFILQLSNHANNFCQQVVLELIYLILSCLIDWLI